MRHSRMYEVLFVAALFATPAALAQTSFSNTNPISLPATPTTAPLAASPYPSTITVTGLSGTVSKVTVTLHNWTESAGNAYPEDRGFMLVGPSGATFEFLGGVGSFNPFSNATVTLDDSAASQPGTTITSGTFKPKNAFTQTCANYPSPAPASSACAAPEGTATFASVFNGSAPNGSWSLYAMDILTGDPAGTVSGGWTITITVAAPASTTTVVSSNLNPSFTTAPNNSVTLTATVTSLSPVTGTVTFFDGTTDISGGGVALNSSGQAQLITSFTTEGSHAISAQFNGNSSFATSTGYLTQEVDNHTVVTGPTFCNQGNITLNTTGGVPKPATPYPQRVYLSGLTGSISEMTLQLPNFAPTYPEDVDILLVSPTGATFVPLASAGGTHQPSGVTLTLSDSAASLVPQATTPATGTFLPSDYNSSISFPAPAPGGSYNVPATQGSATFGSSFAGLAANNGDVWSLYVFDHAGGDSGTIGGYCLTFTTSSAAATTTMLSSNENPAFTGDNITLTATVTSGGSPVNAGTVTFKENGTVLAGPTAVVSGQAAFITSTLSEGIHNITALYSGVPGSLNVSSGSLSQEVDHHTTVTGTTYCNPGGITIPANGGTQPYPSRVFVANLPGTVSKVTATLENFTHAFPSDLGALLTGPTGTNLVFWSNAGGNTAVSGLNVTLDDAAASQISSPVVSGTFKPTATSGRTVIFPTPAPTSLSFAATTGTATFASSFSGINPNGTWSFYLFDENAGSGGTVGQVCLNFTENAVTGTGTTSHVGHAPSNHMQQGGTGSVTLSLHNNGDSGGNGSTGDPDGTHPMVVTGTLPSGLTFGTVPTGTPWNCVASTSTTVSCNSDSAVAAGSSYPLLTLPVNVAGNAPSSVTVSGFTFGGAGMTGGTFSSDTITIDPLPTTVTNVTSTTANGTYGVGAALAITVTFSRTVTVTGTPLLALNSGGTASYSSGSGTATLTFNYTVAAGQNSAHLDATSSTALTLNGGTIVDSSSQPAVLTLPAPGAAGSLGANKSITIDTVAPTVVSYSVLWGVESYNVIGSSRNRLPWQISGIQVVFSKPIASGTTASLGGLSATGFSGLGTTTLTWTINPVALGALSTTLAGSGANALKDAAGNALAGGAGFAQLLKILEGDFNDDGVVNAQDFVLINNARSQAYNIFADINGDGVVNLTDVTIARGRNGTTLP